VSPKLTQLFEDLKKKVADAEGDVAKAAEGVKAAGTRARKAMMEVKNLAQDLRKAIINAQNEKELGGK
jgi:outer membrane murein-binding lipoprotein Lpp